MHKIKFISLLLLLSVFAPSAVFAATGLSLSPASGNYTEGQTVNVSILVNPQGDKVFTVKAELKYPADLLEVQSFTFAGSWMPVSQPGYDLIDNTGGVLIKTAGYPGGLSSQATLGTAVFKVKKPGSAIIKVTTNSQILDGNNQNVFDGILSQATLTLTEKKVSVAPAPPPQKTVEIEQPKITTEVSTEQEALAEETQEETQTAAVVTAAQERGYGLWLIISVAISALVIGFLFGRNTDLVTSFIKRK